MWANFLKCIKYSLNIFFPIYKNITRSYQKNKEKFQKNACESYQNPLEQEKTKEQKYGREQCKYFSEEEKYKRCQYQCEHDFS